MAVRYSDGTDVTRRDSAATPTVASESFFRLADRHQVACAGRWDLDWVPEAEAPVVPDAIRDLCQPCPLRQPCLTAAIHAGLDGYWGATTRHDRRLAQGAETPAAADLSQLLRWARQQLHQHQRRAAQARCLHPGGAGSAYQYRLGCRCSECVQAKVAQRAQEKSRARQRKLAAA